MIEEQELEILENVHGRSGEMHYHRGPERDPVFSDRQRLSQPRLPCNVKRRKIKEGEPYRFHAPDGTEITVGKNAVQNDRITLHARANETWLHAQGVAGSHVLIRTEEEPADETLLFAAKLADLFQQRAQPSELPD